MLSYLIYLLIKKLIVSRSKTMELVSMGFISLPCTLSLRDHINYDQWKEILKTVTVPVTVLEKFWNHSSGSSIFHILNQQLIYDSISFFPKTRICGSRNLTMHQNETGPFCYHNKEPLTKLIAL